MISGAILSSPVQALPLEQGFAGAYAPSNWTFTSNPALGDGSVNTAAAPASILITGSDSGNVTQFRANVDTDYTTAAAASGAVSFDWNFTTSDMCVFCDGFGFLLNGAFTQIAVGSTNLSGSSQFNVLAGDTFGFRVYAIDNGFGPGSATISNFSAPAPAPAPVPGPLPLLGLGAAYGYSRRLRRRISLANRPVSTTSGTGSKL